MAEFLDELREKKHDVVLFGTGLTECILSGLQSLSEKVVLHCEKNDYYGGEGASLELEKFFKMYPASDEDQAEQAKRAELLKLKRSTDWNIDLNPKVLIEKGFLRSLLVNTKVSQYLEFSRIKGSYVMENTELVKVPTNSEEAISFKTKDPLQKLYLKEFLGWVAKFKKNEKATYTITSPFPRIFGKADVFDETYTMRRLYESFGLHKRTYTFIEHAIALHSSESYLDQADRTLETIQKVKLYGESIHPSGSPFIYSCYGGGEIAQAFARASAVHNGEFIMNTVLNSLKLEDNVVKGVDITTTLDNQEHNLSIQCEKVIADLSYFPEYVRKEANPDFMHKITLILDFTKLDNSLQSKGPFQIIYPSPPAAPNDIYALHLTSDLGVCPKGYSIAIITTAGPEGLIAASVMKPVLDLFRPAILHQTTGSTQILKPVPSSQLPKGFHISNGYDASTHYETITDNVYQLFKDITGGDLQQFLDGLSKHSESHQSSNDVLAAQSANVLATAV